MKRFASIAFFLLCFVAGVAYAAFVSEPGGSSTCSLGKGSACYRDFTAAAADAVNVQMCESVKVTFRSDITDDTNNDGVASIYCCPAGVTTVAESCGKPIPYLYSGTEYTTLTGATGRDAIYGIVCQNLVADVTTVESTETARVQVDCR